MSFRWRSEQTPIVLDLYKAHECLWNPSHIHYKDKLHREKAISTMVKALNLPGLTGGDLKNKIKSIRTKYSAELQKIARTQNSDVYEEVWVPRLFWYEQADVFLRKVTRAEKNRMPFYNITKRFRRDIQIEPEQEQESLQDNQLADEHEDEPLSAEDINDLDDIKPNIVKVESAKVKSVKYNNKPQPITRIDSMPINVQHKVENDDTFCEFDVFCQSLAIQLKKMPLKRALICQMKLQKIVTKERLEQLRGYRRTVDDDFSDPSIMSSPASEERVNFSTS